MKLLFSRQHRLAQRSHRVALTAIGAIVALSSSIVAHAGDSKTTIVTESTSWEKPAWLTDLGLGVRESFDTNVFLAGAGQEYFPATLPQGEIAYKNQTSWVTTISPKIGVDFAKFLDKDSPLKLLSLGYVPDFVIFHDASSETYSAHRVTTAIKAASDPVAVSIENAFTYIDGEKDTLLYPGGASAYANGTIRERRNQWQDRAKVSIKVTVDDFFIRPTASLLYYDLNTNFRNVSVYSNFIDRYDLNGGVDLGYNLNKNAAFTVGYRYGHQEQAALPFDTAQTNVSNDYQRVLFGFEGTPLKWLKVEAAVGPQFTTYNANRPFNGGVAANGQIEKDPTDVYAEASVTISPTPSDALVFKYKRWNWVSSTGKNAYIDTLYDATFKHQITKALQLNLGLRASNSDYNPSSYRNDWDYTASAGVKYVVTKNLVADVTYAYDLGENDQFEGVQYPATREFDRSIVSAGLTWSF